MSYSCTHRLDHLMQAGLKKKKNFGKLDIVSASISQNTASADSSSTMPGQDGEDNGKVHQKKDIHQSNNSIVTYRNCLQNNLQCLNLLSFCF